MVWGSRVARVGVVLVLVLVIGLTLYANHVLSQIRVGDCPDRAQPDVSMLTLVNLKHRLERYQVDPSVDAHLELTGPEASFLLHDLIIYEVWIGAEGDEVDALVVRRQDEQCLTIHYQGGVQIQDGTLLLQPTSLIIGEADLTSWLSLGLSELPADWIPDPVAAKVLSNIHAMEVEDGTLHLQFTDRWSIWN